MFDLIKLRLHLVLFYFLRKVVPLIQHVLIFNRISLNSWPSWKRSSFTSINEAEKILKFDHILLYFTFSNAEWFRHDFVHKCCLVVLRKLKPLSIVARHVESLGIAPSLVRGLTGLITRHEFMLLSCEFKLVWTVVALFYLVQHFIRNQIESFNWVTPTCS